jgi:hypothetical protein
MDARESLLLELVESVCGVAQLTAHHLARQRRPADTVSLAHHARGRIEHDGICRHAVALGERLPAFPSLGIQSRRVDHRRQPASEPLGGDQIQHLERVAAGALVTLARAYDRAHSIRGQDLLSLEPRLGPVRLARRRRPDEDYQTRIRESKRRTLEHCLGHGHVLPHPILHHGVYRNRASVATIANAAIRQRATITAIRWGSVDLPERISTSPGLSGWDSISVPTVFPQVGQRSSIVPSLGTSIEMDISGARVADGKTTTHDNHVVREQRFYVLEQPKAASGSRARPVPCGRCSARRGM